MFERHDAAGRGAVDRRGVPRRRRAAADLRHARPRSRCGCGARCSSGSVCRSPSGWPGPSSSPRWPAAWPSPTACSWCRPTRELAFLHPLPVERLWGVGAGDRRASCTTAGSRPSARSPRLAEAALVSMLGRASGRHLHALAHNRDPRPVQVGRRRRSIGSQRALGRVAEIARRTSTPSLVGLVDRVTRRLRAAGRVGRTVVLRLRFDDFSRATRSHTLPRGDRADPDDPRHGAGAARRRPCR